MNTEDHVRIAQNMIKKSKTSTDVIYLIISQTTGKARLMDIKGNDVSSYGDFIQKSKARLVAMFVIYIDVVLSHVIVTLHDMRYKKRIMVFDNMGGQTPHVKFISNFLKKQMKRPDLVFEDMSGCPVKKIDGFDCAYWTLAFFKYMMDHPTGTISGFQHRFSKQMYEEYFEHNNRFLKAHMKKYKKHVHKTLPNSSELEKMFQEKLAVN
jgi:flavorubredoxin